ncbi:hypothetical protein GNI_043350 [Gregarina niphandrodes]|uniref:START domain-containing protein n=1 Tax=Gregarina niphandrodes TaxID=110365 RepID=A0A023BA42_GRENI|nr:hypothetical protein GNI_043350 [Gregarina niphandrodes]EZG77012.1 hypothetical protein GNI_043350 [Gregarina niphandrodes]|eukprot:XP_011129539.1 hypothetical protein GNI_043350 [Gregarina niphandrodes]
MATNGKDKAITVKPMASGKSEVKSWRGELGSTKSRGHLSRSLCLCLDDFEIDREVVCELLSRDLVHEAFWSMMAMIGKHSGQRIVADDDLFVCVAKYDHMVSCLEMFSLLKPTHMEHYSEPTSAHDGWPREIIRMTNGAYNKSKRLQASIPQQREWTKFCESYQKRQSQEGRTYYGPDFLQSSVQPVVCVDDPTLFASYVLDPKVSVQKTQILAQSWIDLKFDGLLSVTAQVDMTKFWVPSFKFPIRLGLNEAVEVVRTGRMERTSLYKVDLPWPVTNRQVYLHGWLADDLHNQSAMIVFRAFEPENYPYHPLLQTLDPKSLQKTDGFTDMFVEGCCLISHIDMSKNKVLARLFWNIDLKTRIPNILISFVTKTFIRMGLNALARACKDASECNGEWKAIRDRDPWLYEYISRRLTEERNNADNVSLIPDSTFGTDSPSRVSKRSRWRRFRKSTVSSIKT